MSSEFEGTVVEELQERFRSRFGEEFPRTWLPRAFVEPVVKDEWRLWFSELIREAPAPASLELFEKAPAGTWLAGIVAEEGVEFWCFARKDGRRETFLKLPCEDAAAAADFAVRADEFAMWAKERPWRIVNDRGRCSGWVEWRDGKREELVEADAEAFRFPHESPGERERGRRSLKPLPPDDPIFKMGPFIGLRVIPPSR